MKKITNNKINFFKKNLIKIIRKLGYEVIDQNNLTIPNKDKKINEDISLINNRITNIPLGYIDIEKKINKVLIILRTFTNENKLLSQSKKRIFEKEKKIYSLKSLKSICLNIQLAEKKFTNLDFYLKVIDDNSSEDILKNMDDVCNQHNIKFDIENLDINKFESKLNFKDNKRMIAHNCHIYQSKEFALKSDYDLIYFLEDDYIHKEDALIEMVYTYQKLSNQINDGIVLCPADYPYLYQKFEPSNIVIGHNRHWRLVYETLCTYMVSRETLVKFLPYYEEMYLNNHDPYEKSLHDLYKRIYCFSPIPSLAMHVTNINSVYGLPPLIDWEKLWNKF